jgi:putative nucleotidyltransferase with HDIG domain
MNRLRLTWYVRLVVLAGGAVLVQSAASLIDTPHPWEWVLFAALAILAGSFTIDIAPVKASISVADTFFITTALLFGPAPAAITLAVDTLLLSWRKRRGRMREAFNIVSPAASLWVAAHVFFMLAGVPPLSTARVAIAPLITPLLCLTAIYFCLNSGLIAVAIGLEAQKSPLRIWQSHFMWLGLGYFAAASVSLCLTIIIQQIGISAVAVIIPVVLVFHLTLRASFGRLEDADRHVKQVDRLYTSTVETLAMAIDAKDDVTHNHVRRVQAYATTLARELGIDDEPTLKAIEAAALLHDTGKLAVPERILNKPGGLTKSEFEEMKRHVDIGADILTLVDFPYPVVPIVRCHHENWDGSGYPNGIVGANIPIGARILSVVDCFDALTSDRPYRRALSDDAAIAILRERSGKMYDPLVVDTFIRIHRDVKLNELKDAAAPEVLQRISQSHHPSTDTPETAVHEPVPAPAPSAVPSDVLAFVSLARLASGVVSMNDVLALSTNLITHIVANASGAWFVVKESGDRLMVADAFGPCADRLRGYTIAMGQGLTGWVAANCQPIVNSDAALDLGNLAAHLDPPLKSCLSVPLHMGQKVYGVLTLYSPDAHAFDENQGRLIDMIAPHIAQAIESARNAAVAPPTQAVGAGLKIVSRH